MLNSQMHEIARGRPAMRQSSNPLHIQHLACIIRQSIGNRHSPFRYEERMAIDPELLEILACPNCKTKVELVKNGTALKCGECKRVYPIRDDIPVMLLDEATVEQ
jgi:uncharacterized protein YbaR (Trm112 family)